MDIAARPGLHAIRTGHGPAMLLLHGIGSSATSWQRQIDRLRDDFRLIAPDLRGYGDSPEPDGSASLDAVADDVAALLSAEAGPIHVVGVSFGALVALALARRHPDRVRSLVLADATLGRAAVSDADRAQWLAGRYALADDLQSRSTDRAREIAGPGAAGDVIEEIAANMRRARPSGYRAVADIIARTDATAWLAAVAVPTLVLCGSHDGVVGLPLSQRMAAAIPDARLATIAGAGHAPHIERPDAFAQAVRAFADGIDFPARAVRVAVAGAGAIANVLIDGIAAGDGGIARVVAVARPAAEAAVADERIARQSARATDDFAALGHGATLVIEAASQAVVRQYARGWLEAGADVMILSAGALIDPDIMRELRAAARTLGRRLYVPSGAVAGIDGIRAGALAGLHSIRLTTTKPPIGLAGAPHVIAERIDLDALTVATTIFDGSVTDAVRAFPSNVNVAAVLALAGGGAVDVRVRVVADPHATTNVHEIDVAGAFGSFTVRLDNLPSPANPKTSALAPLSALAMLRRLSDSLWVGA